MPFAELLPGTRRALSHRMATAQVEGRAPSLVGAVVRDGQPKWSGGFGLVEGLPPTTDTQYRIGSLTKTFVAVLVMRLRDEGLLYLGDPLERHLPDTGVGEITVAHLLAHTSGLASEAPGPWWERTRGELRPELSDVLGDEPMRHDSGRRFHYSNPGYTLLGALVERLRGEPWGSVLRREILQPLGMSRTTLLPQAPFAHGWAVHPWADVLLPEPAQDVGRMAPAGQLWSTAADLCRFAAFLAQGDAAVLHADTLAEMRAPASGPEGNGWEAGYGLGLQLKRADGRLLFGHTGSMPGFLAALWVSADDDASGVVLANCTAGLAVGRVASDLVRIVAEHEPRIPAPWTPLPDVDPQLLALTGAWYWGPTGFALRLCADRALELAPLSGTGRGTRFRAERDGTWTGLEGYYAGETMRVVRDAEGRVTHFDVGSFVFTREPYDAGAPVPGGVDPQGWRAG